MGRLTARSDPVRLPRSGPNVTAGLGSTEWVASRHAEPPYGCWDTGAGFAAAEWEGYPEFDPVCFGVLTRPGLM